MSLLGVGGLFAILTFFAPAGTDVSVWATKIPFLIVGYGFGASFVALFAQLGGGIYTKAADVGADLALDFAVRDNAAEDNAGIVIGGIQGERHRAAGMNADAGDGDFIAQRGLLDALHRPHFRKDFACLK